MPPCWVTPTGSPTSLTGISTRSFFGHRDLVEVRVDDLARQPGWCCTSFSSTFERLVLADLQVDQHVLAGVAAQHHARNRARSAGSVARALPVAVHHGRAPCPSRRRRPTVAAALRLARLLPPVSSLSSHVSLARYTLNNEVTDWLSWMRRIASPSSSATDSTVTGNPRQSCGGTLSVVDQFLDRRLLRAARCPASVSTACVTAA